MSNLSVFWTARTDPHALRRFWVQPAQCPQACTRDMNVLAPSERRLPLKVYRSHALGHQPQARTSPQPEGETLNLTQCSGTEAYYP